MDHLAKEVRSHGHWKHLECQDENKVKYVGLSVPAFHRFARRSRVLTLGEHS